MRFLSCEVLEENGGDQGGDTNNMSTALCEILNKC